MPQDFSGQDLQGRNFEEQDLTEANFSQADIRGANFANAILQGVNFTEAKAGLQKRWVVGHLLIALILSALSGVLSSFAGSIAAVFLNSDSIRQYTSIPGIIILVVLAVTFIAIICQGFTAAVLGTLAVVGAGAGAGAVVVAVIGAGTVAVIGAVAGAVAVISAVAVAVAVVGVGAVAGVGTVIGAVAFAGRGTGAVAVAIIVTAASLLLGYYIARRANKGDEKFALIRTINVALGAIGGTSFRGSNLTGANFTGATLKSSRFMHSKQQQTNLTQVCWKNTQKLDRARLGNSYLQYPRIRQLVTTGQGQDQNFDRLNLSGINLKGSTLQDASFVSTDLNDANLQDADLSRAKLKQTQLDRADLTGACLTGAYIEDWGLTGETKLNGVRCEYVFMRVPTKTNPDLLRKPDNQRESFKDGDFADFIQPFVDTLDLYHNQDVDPRAISLAFKHLSKQRPNAELRVVAMEVKGEDKFLMRVKTTAAVDKSELSSEYFDYYSQAKALPANARLLLAEKDDRIRAMENMIGTALNQATFNIQGNFMPENNKNSGINFNAGGNIENVSGIFGGDVSGVVNLGEISGNVSNTINQLQNGDRPEAAQLAELLKQLQAEIEASNLKPDDKTEALEQVGAIAKAGQNPQDGTLKKLSATAIKILQGTVAALPDTAKLAVACSQLLPLIKPLIGLS